MSRKFRMPSRIRITFNGNEIVDTGSGVFTSAHYNETEDTLYVSLTDMYGTRSISVVDEPDFVLDPDGPVVDRAAVLAGWWREVAESEIDMVVAKATEYGGGGNAIDLLDIGRDLARTQSREVSDEEATELGIYFYLRGKLSRWTAAIIEHRRVSDDTITDINVYSRMAQRTRLKGGWPGV